MIKTHQVEKEVSYTYQGKTSSIVSGDYRSSDDGLLLKEIGTNNYLSFRFPNTGAYNIAVQTLKFNGLPPNNAGLYFKN